MENHTQYDLWLTKAKEHLAANDPSSSKRFVELALRSNPLQPDDLADRIAAVADVLLAIPSNDPRSILQLPADADPTPAAIISSYRRLSLLLHPDRDPNRALPFAAQAFRLVSRAYSQLSPAPLAEPAAADPPSFWTFCPSCFHVHEYAMDHIGNNILCRKCNKGFSAVKMATPPEIVEGTNMYRCVWGFFPVGLLGGPTPLTSAPVTAGVEPSRREEGKGHVHKSSKPAARKGCNRARKKRVLGTVVREESKEDDDPKFLGTGPMSDPATAGEEQVKEEKRSVPMQVDRTTAAWRAKPAARKSVRPCKKKVLGTVVVEDEEDDEGGGGGAW